MSRCHQLTLVLCFTAAAADSSPKDDKELQKVEVEVEAQAAAVSARRLEPRDIVFPSTALSDPGQSAALPIDLLVRSTPAASPSPSTVPRDALA